MPDLHLQNGVVVCRKVSFNTVLKFLLTALLVALVIPLREGASPAVEKQTPAPKNVQVVAVKSGDGVETGSRRVGKECFRTEGRNETSPRVLFSFLLFGASMRIRMVLQNALDHLEEDSLIVVHISVHEENISGRSDGIDPDWAWIRALNASNPRLTINPTTYRTRGWSGTILYGHLQNFEYASSLWPGDCFAFFVIMSADALIVRKGIEAWVRVHKLSFSINYAGDREYDLPVWRKKIRDKIRNDRYPLLPNDVHLKTEAFVNIFDSDYFPRMLHFGMWWKGRKYLNHYQHEGTFYPRALVREIIDFLKGADLFETLPRIGFDLKASWPEEVWIPSYLLKNAQPLLLTTDFSPPLAVRLETRCYSGNDCFTSVERAESLLRGNGGWSSAAKSIFMLKLNYPNLDFEYTSMYAERCKKTDPACCNFESVSRGRVDVNKFFKLGHVRNKSQTPLDELMQLSPNNECMPWDQARAS